MSLNKVHCPKCKKKNYLIFEEENKIFVKCKQCSHVMLTLRKGEKKEELKNEE